MKILVVNVVYDDSHFTGNYIDMTVIAVTLLLTKM